MAEPRAHSKFSASGAERWFQCPGSVNLSEGMPAVDTPWSLEGNRAHKVLEAMLCSAIENRSDSVNRVIPKFREKVPSEMFTHGLNAANFILLQRVKAGRLSEILVETRIYLKFLHPEMFGTFDGAVVDHFGTLHVFDYKYGKYAVSPVENLQLLFYGIGLAHRYHWNFKRVRVWIIQPRSRGYTGPTFWELPIFDLKKRVGEFARAVETVEKQPNKYVEGSWCFFCLVKGKCPLKQQGRVAKAKSVFATTPIK